MPHIPKIRHAALVPCRGEENLALSLLFERPLEPKEQGLFLGELASFALEGCEVYEPRFSNDGIICLHPVKGQGRLEEADYLELLNHLGLHLDAASLPIKTGQCSDDEDNVVTVVQETSYVH